jgi:hypothetical protein
VVVAEAQRTRHRLVDDGQGACRRPLLSCSGRGRASMPVVSQSISRPMVPVGASTAGPGCCARRTLPSRTRLSHACWPAEQALGDRVLVDLVAASRCMRSTFSMYARSRRSRRTAPWPAGRAGAGGVRVTGHQRGERGRPRAPLGRVVGVAQAISSAPRLA